MTTYRIRIRKTPFAGLFLYGLLEYITQCTGVLIAAIINSLFFSLLFYDREGPKALM